MLYFYWTCRCPRFQSICWSRRGCSRWNRRNVGCFSCGSTHPPHSRAGCSCQHHHSLLVVAALLKHRKALYSAYDVPGSSINLEEVRQTIENSRHPHNPTTTTHNKTTMADLSSSVVLGDLGRSRRNLSSRTAAATGWLSRIGKWSISRGTRWSFSRQCRPTRRRR
jgi:hypothetical protein